MFEEGYYKVKYTILTNNSGMDLQTDHEQQYIADMGFYINSNNDMYMYIMSPLATHKKGEQASAEVLFYNILLISLLKMS